MSDGSHLLIPYAASGDPGCRQTLESLSLPHLERLLARLAPQEVADHAQRADQPGVRAATNCPGMMAKRAPYDKLRQIGGNCEAAGPRLA